MRKKGEKGREGRGAEQRGGKVMRGEEREGGEGRRGREGGRSKSTLLFVFLRSFHFGV